jgi:predicted CopG family antitoxin
MRLASLKMPNESFTDVINRPTGRRSILELAGTLTKEKGDELRRRVEKLHITSDNKLSTTTSRMREPY